jgi:hypothetical protein
MIKRGSQLLCAWFLLWDLLVTGGAWLGAYVIRFETGWVPITKEPPGPDYCWRMLPLVVVFAAIAYRFTGQYVIHRLRRFREEVVCVLKGTALLALLMMANTFFLHAPYESRAAMIIFWVLRQWVWL